MADRKLIGTQPETIEEVLLGSRNQEPPSRSNLGKLQQLAKPCRRLRGDLKYRRVFDFLSRIKEVENLPANYNEFCIMKYYAYFFTRQDISPEQQVVQTAHAAFKLGVMSQRAVIQYKTGGDEYIPAQFNQGVDPDETYFTVIGVRDLAALNAVKRILTKFGYRHEVFLEPDLRDGENTSIAVYPISEFHKDVLMAFNLLKINR